MFYILSVYIYVEHTHNFFLSLKALNVTKNTTVQNVNIGPTMSSIQGIYMYRIAGWPGTVTVVAWHGWSRHWCARGPGFDSEGNHPF